MAEITKQTQVNIEELEKAITLWSKDFKYRKFRDEEFTNILYIQFPDFTFTKIGREWKVTQDLRETPVNEYPNPFLK